MSRLPRNRLIQHRTGCWGFIGTVDVPLAYCRLDGSRPTEEQIKIAQQFGPRLARLKTRLFATELAALTALKAEEGTRR